MCKYVYNMCIYSFIFDSDLTGGPVAAVQAEEEDGESAGGTLTALARVEFEVRRVRPEPSRLCEVSAPCV